MKKMFLTLALAVMSLSFLATSMPVEAKRLGGGSTSGMKRQAPPPSQPPQSTPNTPANPGTAGAATGATAAGTAAAAGKRSWMGPIAGLAAGLGIAALMSHLGLGEAFGNFLMMALLAVAAIFLVRFLMRRLGHNAAHRSPAVAAPQGMQFAGIPMPRDGNAPAFGSAGMNAPFASAPAQATSSTAHSLRAGFDAAAFERIAKLIFIRMQAANDAGNLDDLRQFATPEMFATFKLDLQDRQSAAQETDVVQLHAHVLEFVQEGDQQIVSVRFHGLIREPSGTGVDATGLNLDLVDNAPSRRCLIQARVPLADGSGLLTSRWVDLAGGQQEGLPWRVFHADSRIVAVVSAP